MKSAERCYISPSIADPSPLFLVKIEAASHQATDFVIESQNGGLCAHHVNSIKVTTSLPVSIGPEINGSK